MFHQNIFNMKEGIRQSIKDNGIAIIENALLPDIAEDLYRDLNATSAWKRQEMTENEGSKRAFKYSRDYIELDYNHAPQSLTLLKEYLRGETSRNFISYISSLPCLWFNGSAARLRPGDSIGLHNDDVDITRTIGFNYYLNKGWEPDWGGEFILMNPHVEVKPTFNTLNLFRVSKTSHHKVNEINAQAKNGRLAISGWFRSAKPKTYALNVKNLKT